MNGTRAELRGCPSCGRPNPPDLAWCWGCQGSLSPPKDSKTGPTCRTLRAAPRPLLAAAAGLGTPSDAGITDPAYRGECWTATAAMVVVTLLVGTALLLPWFTTSVHPYSLCSPVSCIAGPGPGPDPTEPFLEYNLYLYAPPSAAHNSIAWQSSLIVAMAAFLLGVASTLLFGLMAVGKGVRLRLGRYACGSATVASAAAILAPVVILAWAASQGSIWGHWSSWSELVVWGPGIGLYMCLGGAVVAFVNATLARHDLGEGEMFHSRAGPAPG